MQTDPLSKANQKIVQSIELAKLNSMHIYKYFMSQKDQEKAGEYLEIADTLLNINKRMSQIINNEISLVKHQET